MAHTAKGRYEYVILACCFAFLFVNVGFISTTFNVFQPHITELIGDSLGSMMLLVRNLVSFAAMLFVAAYYEKLDCRLGVVLATGLTVIGSVIFALGSTFPVFCLASVFTGAAYGLGGAVGMTLLVGRWFEGRTGTAVGIATMGSGAAAVVMPLAISAVIEATSLSGAFLMEAGIACAVGLLCFVLLKNWPEGTGPAAQSVSAHGSAHAGDQVSGHRKQHAHISMLEASVLPKRGSALMLIAMACLGVASLGGTTYYGVLLTTSGFDAAFAAKIIAVGGAILLLSKFLAGIAFDKLGTLPATILFFLFLVCGTVLAWFSGRQLAWLCICSIVIMYFGVSLATVGVAQWSLKLSTPETRAKSVRNFQLFYTLGGLISNFFPGFLMDHVGNYVVSYVVFTGCAAAAMIIVVVCLLRARKYL